MSDVNPTDRQRSDGRLPSSTAQVVGAAATRSALWRTDVEYEPRQVCDFEDALHLRAGYDASQRQGIDEP